MSDRLEALVEALLWEGYALYPYTPEATKNATPTPFGIVYPPSYAGAVPGAFDALQVVLVVSALLADAVALWAIAARISEFGFSPNRVAALGENVILLVNLAWAAVLYIRFLRGRGSFADLERWQTDYLPIFVVWAAIVVVAFPPLFGFI